MTISIPMNNLKEGQSGVIISVPSDHLLYGRLSDLGIIKGTSVKCVRKKRGTAAYSIRQTVFAMRESDVENIMIQLCEAEEND